MKTTQEEIDMVNEFEDSHFEVELSHTPGYGVNDLFWRGHWNLSMTHNGDQWDSISFHRVEEMQWVVDALQMAIDAERGEK